MDRIYHRYEKWEDFKHGFYDKIEKSKEPELINKCVELLSSGSRFSEACNMVTMFWKYSCEHNLTNQGMNQIAWMGQAACAYVLNAPEYITKQAWHKLNEAQQYAANYIAKRAIEKWQISHKEGVCQK